MTWDWTQVSQTIGELLTHWANALVKNKNKMYVYLLITLLSWHLMQYNGLKVRLANNY